MLDRGLDRESRASRRYGFQQEAVNLTAVNQVHQQLAIVSPTRYNGDQTRHSLTQSLRQNFYIRADHRGVGHEYANLVVPCNFLRLCRRYTMMYVMQPA